MVGYVIYGRGSFNQLDEIIAPHRKPGSPMVFLVDHFFEGKPLASRVPLRGNDKIIFADVTYEPKTTYVDKLANELKAEFGTVSGVVGIGGGSTMDIAKALIDEGYHPMTMYFPLVVHGAMLIEPTETESRAALDQFIGALRSVALRAKEGDSALKAAPHFAPRRRLDETLAARKPVLVWKEPEQAVAAE